MDHRPDSPRDRLVETAGLLFAKNGYARTTLREICEAAQVNVAAVGYYFHGKRRLHDIAVHMAADIVKRELCECPPATPPLEKLRCFIDRLVYHSDHSVDSSWPMRLVLRELHTPERSDANTVREATSALSTILSALVRELLPASRQADDLSLITFSILAQCVSSSLAMHIGDDETGPDLKPSAIAKHIYQYSLAALSEVTSEREFSSHCPGKSCESASVEHRV